MLGGLVLTKGGILANFKELHQGNKAAPLQFDPELSFTSIFQALYVFDGTKCGDPRDLVFALKHASSLDRGLIRVDYNQDVRDAYLTLVKTLSLQVPMDADFSMSYQDTFAVISGTVHSINFIQSLALTSCKKNETREPPIESWVPDWRIETSFESFLHGQAVETAVMGLRTRIQPEIPWKLHVAYSGYHYLQLTGLLLKPLDTPLYAESHTEYLYRWARTKTLTDIGFERWPPEMRHLRRIWLVKGRYEVKNAPPQYNPWMAFVLEPGRSATSIQGKLVYHVHSCFLVYERDESMRRPDKVYVKGVVEAPWTTKERHGITTHDTFYLE